MTLQELVDTLHELIAKGVDTSTIVRIDKAGYYGDARRVSYVVDSEVVPTHRESIIIG